MRLSSFVGLAVTLLSFAIGPVLAQAGLPKCAATCFAYALGNQTDCAFEDMPCICASAPINAAIQGCVGMSCTVKEALVAVNTTSTICQAPIRDRSAILAWVTGVSGAVALLATIIRVIVALVANSFGWDDGFAILAWLFSMPLTVLQSITPHIGFGKDTWTVEPKYIYKILQMIYASQVGYFLCSGFTKLCFLFFYLRIFPAKNVRKVVFVFIGITIAYTLAFDLTMIFACDPISGVWTSWAKDQAVNYCINQNKFYYCAAAVNITIDICILVIPIPELLKLKLSTKRKLFLLSIFSVGGITIVVSCIRLQFLAQYAASQNPLYDNLNSGIYSVLETNVGVICICMPSFRRFLATLVPKCFGTTQDDSKYNKYEDGTPNARYSSGKRSNPKFKKSTLGGSLFETNIIKTVDTRVTSAHSDDEVRLVQLQKNGKGAAPSTGSVEGQESVKHTNMTSPEENSHQIK